MLGVAMSTAFGGHSVTLAPNVTYVIVEVGSAAVWGAGAFLLGLALIALSIAARGVFPAWLRAATAIAGLGGLTGVAFFPSGLLILWAPRSGYGSCSLRSGESSLPSRRRRPDRAKVEGALPCGAPSITLISK